MQDLKGLLLTAEGEAPEFFILDEVCSPQNLSALLVLGHELPQ